MESHDLAIIFLLMSRLPIYLFVIHKAWQYRHKIVLVSANWLGAVAFSGMLGALSNAFGPRLLSNIFGTIFSLSLFMLAHTTKKLVKVE